MNMSLERSCKFIKSNTFVKSTPTKMAQQTKSLRQDSHFKIHNAAAISLSCLSEAESDTILLPTQ